MKITKAMVLTGRGADHILLTTDMPNGCWPYNGNQTVKLEVAAGTGVDYVRKNISIELEVVNIDSANHQQK